MGRVRAAAEMETNRSEQLKANFRASRLVPLLLPLVLISSSVCLMCRDVYVHMKSGRRFCFRRHPITMRVAPRPSVESQCYATCCRGGEFFRGETRMKAKSHTHKHKWRDRAVCVGSDSSSPSLAGRLVNYFRGGDEMVCIQMKNTLVPFPWQRYLSVAPLAVPKQYIHSLVSFSHTDKPSGHAGRHSHSQPLATRWM